MIVASVCRSGACARQRAVCRKSVREVPCQVALPKTLKNYFETFDFNSLEYFNFSIKCHLLCHVKPLLKGRVCVSAHTCACHVCVYNFTDGTYWCSLAQSNWKETNFDLKWWLGSLTFKLPVTDEKVSVKMEWALVCHSSRRRTASRVASLQVRRKRLTVSVPILKNSWKFTKNRWALICSKKNFLICRIKTQCTVRN